MRTERKFQSLSLPVKTGEVLNAGDLVALKDGELVLGRSETGLVNAYVVHELDSVSSERAVVSVGCYLFKIDSDISTTSIGSIAYIKDSNMVTLDGTGRSIAGEIRDIDSTDGVWVELKGGH